MPTASRDTILGTYRAAIRGDLGGLTSTLASLETDDRPVTAAYRALLLTVSESLRDAAPTSALVDLASRMDELDAEGRALALMACANAHRSAWLTWDRGAAQRANHVVRALREDADATAILPADLVRLRSLLVDGFPAAPKHAKALAARAAKLGDAATVIEASSLRALATLEEGDPAEGLRLARRASRMARTEGLLEQEYLANIVLARARRYNGQHALASRILSALIAVCPPTWRGWLSWELALSGEMETAERVWIDGRGPVADAASSLVAALRAATNGDPAALREHLDALDDVSSPFPLHQRVIDSLRPALDREEALDDAHETVRRWLTCESHRPPLLLLGLATPSASRSAAALTGTVVLGSAAPSPRRILKAGTGLLPPKTQRLFDVGGDAIGLPEALVARLALVGAEGMDAGTLFEEVFGFEREPVRHDGLFRTTLYRARGLLASAGNIRREGERLAVLFADLVVIADPFAEAAPHERALRALAARGGQASARDLAADLQVSLRTIQTALQQLVADDACARVKVGRAVHYSLEDTTFSEPTLHRLRPT